MSFLFCLISICFSLSSPPASPDKSASLKVNQLFTDHMVLQQKSDVCFWGKAEPGQRVSVSGSWGKQVSEVAKSNGSWSLKLATPKAGGPYIISIKSNQELIVIKDVLIGELWLASGQSNMDLPLNGWRPTDTVIGANEEIAKAQYPQIRFFKVPFNISAAPIDSIGGQWTAMTPQTAGDFSATAFFYAKKLQQQLHVPIGIIQSSIGGTPAEAWTSETNLKKLGDFNSDIEKLKNVQVSKDSWLAKWKVIKSPIQKDLWKEIDFDDRAASKIGFDDSNWAITQFPGRFDKLPDGEFDGAMWVRKSFLVEDLTTDYQLHIDAIDDMDATFINGINIGFSVGDGVANAPRNYMVPKSILKKGENTIAIRLIDTGGPGAMSDKLILSNASNTISLDGDWKSKLVAELLDGNFYSYGLKSDLTQRPDLYKMNSNSPTVLFNAMINPLIPYTIKGVIWYQGESNVGRAKQYAKLFPIMIDDWRAHWGYQFPFYFVQIAPFKYTDPSQREQSQKLRNAQRLALERPKTGMVTTLDIGRLDSAHPTHKREVGDRLARFALSNEYGKHTVTSGPLFQKVEQKGNQLVVSFESSTLGSGLMAKGDELKDFEIAGSDQVFVTATALIKGDAVVVSSPSVNKPVYVRYAWSDGAFASLFNKEGLPASTFTSETQL